MKRYDVKFNDMSVPASMQESENGYFVKHEDHQEAMKQQRDIIERLASMEAFAGSRSIDKNNPADIELLERIKFADNFLNATVSEDK